MAFFETDIGRTDPSAFSGGGWSGGVGYPCKAERTRKITSLLIFFYEVHEEFLWQLATEQVKTANSE